MELEVRKIVPCVEATRREMGAVRVRCLAVPVTGSHGSCTISSHEPGRRSRIDRFRIGEPPPDSFGQILADPLAGEELVPQKLPSCWCFVEPG